MKATSDKWMKSSPWGIPDYREELAEGIVYYGTPSHGGVKLSASRLKDMPASLMDDIPSVFLAQCKRGWFEEDGEIARVVIAFPQYFEPEQVASASDTLAWLCIIGARDCITVKQFDNLTEGRAE